MKEVFHILFYFLKIGKYNILTNTVKPVPPLNNGHLSATARISPARLIIIPILIENPPNISHLCTRVAFLGSQGWPFKTGLTVRINFVFFFFFNSAFAITNNVYCLSNKYLNNNKKMPLSVKNNFSSI